MVLNKGQKGVPAELHDVTVKLTFSIKFWWLWPLSSDHQNLISSSLSPTECSCQMSGNSIKMFQRKSGTDVQPKNLISVASYRQHVGTKSLELLPRFCMLLWTNQAWMLRPKRSKFWNVESSHPYSGQQHRGSTQSVQFQGRNPR